MNYAIIIPVVDRVDDLRCCLLSVGLALNRSTLSPDIIISVDGCDKRVITYLNQFSEFKLKVLINNNRIGLRNHIMKCGDISNNYDFILIIEDDVVLSPFALEYVESVTPQAMGIASCASVSLYSFQYGDFIKHPFNRLGFPSDYILAMTGSSWGQVWWSSSWTKFREFANNDSLVFKDIDVPPLVKKWSKQSWKKLYNSWLISESLYSLVPSKSFSVTTGGQSGTHNVGNMNASFSWLVSIGSKDGYKLPSHLDRYDQYLELQSKDRLAFQELAGIPVDLIAFDLNGARSKSSVFLPYVLTTQRQTKFIGSWGLDSGCIFLSIKLGLSGKDVFLVKTENFSCSTNPYPNFGYIGRWLSYLSIKNKMLLVLYFLSRKYFKS